MRFRLVSRLGGIMSSCTSADEKPVAGTGAGQDEDDGNVLYFCVLCFERLCNYSWGSESLLLGCNRVYKLGLVLSV